MKREENHTRTTLLLIILTWIIAQFAILLVVLKQLLRRRERQKASHPRRPQSPPAEGIASRPVSKQESAEKQETAPGAGRLAPYWDVIGLTSAAVTVIGAAIFYIAGWTYEVHWYGYYGIEISQIDLSPPRIMVQGMPGILLLALGISLSLIWFLVGNLFSWWKKALNQVPVQAEGAGIGRLDDIQDQLQFKDRFKPKDVLLIIGRAYIWIYVLVLALAIGLGIATDGQFSQTAFIAALPGLAVTVIVAAAIDANRLVSDMITALARESPRFSLRALLAFLLMRFGVFFQKLVWRLLSIVFGEERQQVRSEAFNKAGVDLGTPEEIFLARQKVFNRYRRIHTRIVQELTEQILKYGLGLILLFLLLVSVAASAILGEFDALRGSRTLSGDWHLPVALLHSTAPIRTLEEYEDENSQSSFVYGPLNLVASDDKVLYLVPPKEGFFFEGQPSLYVIPRETIGGIHLSYRMPDE